MLFTTKYHCNENHNREDKCDLDRVLYVKRAILDHIGSKIEVIKTKDFSKEFCYVDEASLIVMTKKEYSEISALLNELRNEDNILARHNIINIIKDKIING